MASGGYKWPVEATSGQRGLLVASGGYKWAIGAHLNVDDGWWRLFQTSVQYFKLECAVITMTGTSMTSRSPCTLPP